LPSAGSEVASDAVYLVIRKSVCRCCSFLLGAVTVLPSAGRDGHSAAHWACYDTEISQSKIGHIIWNITISDLMIKWLKDIWNTEHFKFKVRGTKICPCRIKLLQITFGGSTLYSKHVTI
jgi:hypothetical protein